MTPPGKPDKHGSVLFNGRSGPWWRVAAVIFAAGVCWAKVNALEKQVTNGFSSLGARVACVERELMNRYSD